MARMKVADLRRWERAFDALDAGLGVDVAVRKSGLSSSTVYRFLRGDQTSGGLVAAHELGRHTVADLAVAKPLAPVVLEALEDFELFRRRYTGRRSAPWQVRAAYDMVEALKTDQREFLVINAPPGSGKSTLFTHDIPCWLIARDRAIRIMLGSRVETIARMYVGRIKKTLERETPMRAQAEDFEAGIAGDAEATMLGDFGAFKPAGRSELWRREALVVQQIDGVSPDDKEPTVSAWGQDSGFLGGRFDIVVWDDLVARANTKTADSIENIREWYTTEAETRLEPGGVFALQGQRIAHNDLYRFALDMKRFDGQPKYRHIKYAAHDDAKCRGHDSDSESVQEPWPNGCLLDPHRLPWRELEDIKTSKPRVYEVQYQQEDGDRVGGLIEPEWITGGVDSQGYVAPGCLDVDRKIGEIPPHLTNGNGWSFVTVDPAPDNWWGVQWWIYDPLTTNRYLIDLIRARLNPEDFLTVDMHNLAAGIHAYSGILEDWRKYSNAVAAPIVAVIVETNAAQKWLVQQPYVQTWMQFTGIAIYPHTTYVNKADPLFGLESIGDVFRQGFFRLPHGDIVARTRTAHLVKEALDYPDGETTDQLMSCWFGKLAVENLYTPGVARRHFPRPDDMYGRRRGLAGHREGRGLLV